MRTSAGEVAATLLPWLEHVPIVNDYLAEKVEAGYKRVPNVSELICDYERVCRWRNNHIVSKYSFNAVVCILTAVCAFVIGYELDTQVAVPLEERMGFFMLDVFFTMFFTIEMLLRQHQLGWDYFGDVWNMFDYTLVVVNLSDLIVSMTAEDGGFQFAAMLRVARVLRIARYVRGIKVFFGMWLLMQGLLNALKTMVWTGLLLVMLLYSLSIISMTVVSDDEQAKERWESHTLYFGDLFRTLLTIIQVFTMDAWASDVARPLLAAGNAVGVLFLIVTIVVCNMGVLNIIISLMVEKISEMKKASELKNGSILKNVELNVYRMLHNDFARAMSDCKDISAGMDFEEFQEVIHRRAVSKKLRLLGFSIPEAISLFDLMDVSKNGKISMDEFVEGLKRVRGPAMGMDIVALISFTNKMARKARDNVRKVQALASRADAIQERLDGIGYCMQCELGYKKHVAKRSRKVLRDGKGVQTVIESLDKDLRCFFPQLEAGLLDF